MDGASASTTDHTTEEVSGLPTVASSEGFELVEAEDEPSDQKCMENPAVPDSPDNTTNAPDLLVDAEVEAHHDSVDAEFEAATHEESDEAQAETADHTTQPESETEATTAEATLNQTEATSKFSRTEIGL